MSRSAKSNMSIGRIRAIWNSATEKMDYFKRTARGKFILCNPFTSQYLTQGPGLDAKQLDRLQKR